MTEVDGEIERDELVVACRFARFFFLPLFLPFPLPMLLSMSLMSFTRRKRGGRTLIVLNNLCRLQLSLALQ